jgi:alkanesulfonate monooxygenase
MSKPIEIYWRVPMSSDSSNWRNKPKTRGAGVDGPAALGNIAPGVRNGESDGLSYVDFLVEAARSAERAGFTGALLPSFPMTEDPFIVSSAIARETTTFRFMVAFQPGFLNPVHAARISASLQRLTNGRLVYNIITGGGGPQQTWWGDTTAHDDRYARTTEFLDVLKGVWDGGPFDYDGRFYQVRGGGLPDALAGQPRPDLYYSGSSDAAIASAIQHADYYLSWLEHPEHLAEKFAHVRERAATYGRRAQCAVRAHVIARPTEEEAWEEVRLGWENLDADKIRRVRGEGGRGDSVGARRQAAYQPEDLTNWEDLVVAPNIWAGIGYLGDFPTVGIVGSYEQAAERLDDLVRIGADSFILSGLSHLEEAYRIGSEVLPRFRGRRALADALNEPREAVSV